MANFKPKAQSGNFHIKFINESSKYYLHCITSNLPNIHKSTFESAVDKMGLGNVLNESKPGDVKYVEAGSNTFLPVNEYKSFKEVCLPPKFNNAETSVLIDLGNRDTIGTQKDPVEIKLMYASLDKSSNPEDEVLVKFYYDPQRNKKIETVNFDCKENFGSSYYNKAKYDQSDQYWRTSIESTVDKVGFKIDGAPYDHTDSNYSVAIPLGGTEAPICFHLYDL